VSHELQRPRLSFAKKEFLDVFLLRSRLEKLYRVLALIEIYAVDHKSCDDLGIRIRKVEIRIGMQERVE
jgi:hypothetical protein